MAEARLQTQHHLYTKISSAYTNLKKAEESNLSKGSVEARLKQLQRNWEKFQDNHEMLINETTSTDLRKDAYFSEDLFSLGEESYFEAYGKFSEILESFQISNHPNAEERTGSSASTGHSGQQRCLPRISLPRFSGLYQDWIPFRDLFQSIVGRNDTLAPVEKLHYLKGSVSGDALRVISGIPVTDEGYARSWEKLSKRFENKRELVNAQFGKLLALKPVTQKGAQALGLLRSTVCEVLEALGAIGASDAETWDYFLAYFVCRYLDAETDESWEIHLGCTVDPPTFQKLDPFLESRIRALESVNARLPSKPVAQSVKPLPRSQSARVHASQSTPATSSWLPCACCGSNHYLGTCSQYREKSANQRRELVESNRVCFNCLGPHRSRECKSTRRCLTCGARHHTTLHEASSNSSTSTLAPSRATTSSVHQAGSSSSATTSGTANSHHTVAVNTISGHQKGMLATALVKVVSPQGHEILSRVLLDQGAEMSFVCEHVAQALQLPRIPSKIALTGIGAQKQITTRGAVRLTLQHRKNPNSEVSVEAHVLSKITGNVPAHPIVSEQWSHLSGLELADPEFNIPGSIDILLGADVYGHLLLGELRKAQTDAPVAQLTSLGWIISGPIIAERWQTPRVAHHCTSLSEEDLHRCVQDFWEQEVVPSVGEGKLSKDAEECERHFQDTHHRNSSGRYVVRLPFVSSPSGFADSRVIAARMLERTRKRFLKDADFQRSYVNFMKEYRDLGHMERLDAKDEEAAYYLSHHGVLRESSATTKLRVVFNGSQRTSSGSSLNDTLHPGPKLQQDLVDVISRWRLHAYVFSSDVEKMYRQIEVHADDRKFQTILWSDNLNTPKSYQLCTVTYGLTCAPYLAIRVLHQLAHDEGYKYPLAAQIVLQNMYVDDLFGGADCLETAQQKALQVDQLLAAGGFRLHKWVANYDEILSPIRESQHVKLEKQFDNQEILRALGLKWSPVSDSFVFTFNEEVFSAPVITKRTVLSMIARLFDPLGWLAPIIVVAKIFLQNLWTAKLQWDDTLPDALAKRWYNFANELKRSSPFTLQRWLGTSNSSFVELHGFSDASRSALAAVVYVRVIAEDFSAKVSLLTAKTRVAPLKNVTIARLELSAAVLLVQLMKRSRDCLGFSEDVPVHLWVDSSVALTWIRGDPARWKEFVCNRVTLIQETLPMAKWHHVSGEQNPADAASRGLLPEQLRSHLCWWRGPRWLELPSTSWPNSLPSLPVDANLEEKPITAHVVVPSVDTWDLIHRYSTVERLMRITARLLDASSRFRHRRSDAEDSRILTPAQLNAALLFWIRLTQQSHFSSEIRALGRAEPISSSSHLRRLTPLLDADGVLRVGGRLQRAALDYNNKHPVIIPRYSKLSQLLIERAHRQTLHGGTQSTLALLRQKFWIVGGRAPIRSFILKCVTCARHRGATVSQQMGQLPSVRTTPSRPFCHSGVDYAGPFCLKTWKGRGAKTYKAFLIIFVCLSTSAIHLEVATDYSTDGFLAAYRRFTSRRGVCSSLRSDCGTNFIGADAELKRLFDPASKDFAELRSTFANDQTAWIFNPPSAPHFGGKWEAGVKSVKFHLRRIVGEAVLTYEELSTVLVQIESILNSRPLCPLSDDPSDLTALTPGHFLVGDSLNAIPEPSLSDVAESRLSRWQKSRLMVEHFWRRWSREYLQRFQMTSKWLLPRGNLHVGSLVLVTDSRFPPTKWPLARVTELHPGEDSFVRVVSVRMASGSTFKRPVVKLCVLPIEENAED